MARFREPDRSLPVRWRGDLEGLVEEDHVARFIWGVLSSLDFSSFEEGYSSTIGGPGRSPYHPRFLTSLWVYGMAVGLETAAAIALACTVRDDFKWLAGGLTPCDQTLLNFLARAVSGLPAVWLAVLCAMGEAGLIDLGTLIEDGTKVHAHASPRSFKTEKEISELLARLRARLEERVAAVAAEGDATRERVKAEVHRLRSRIGRAERAAEELATRVTRRQDRQENTLGDEPKTASLPRTPQFTASDFRLDEHPPALTCPAGETLRLIGVYAYEGAAAYTLFGRSDCGDCPMKARCTSGRGRRVKVPVTPSAAQLVSKTTPPPVDKPSPSEHHASKYGQPVASVTEPEALFMLATSDKHWQPSYNADITVTRDQFVVSQFLTNHPTDYHGFEIACYRRSGSGHPAAVN